MPTRRRGFTLGVLAAGLAVARGSAFGEPVGPISDQTALVSGRDFVPISPPLPGAAAGRIEVIEFFWYGCPHCAAFEPALADWQRRQLPDVVLRRVPVAFRQTPYVAHQQLFYALEALGQLAALHDRVFQTIHRDHVRMDTPAEIADFAAASGIDRAAFLQAYGSFAVQTKAKQATALMQACRVDGVPSFAVQGRFYTSGTLTGSPSSALAVVDALMARLRLGN